MHRERFYTLSASCPDRSGIVAKVSGFIAEHKGWILETALHSERNHDAGQTDRYFMRVEIRADSKITGRPLPGWGISAMLPWWSSAGSWTRFWLL